MADTGNIFKKASVSYLIALIYVILLFLAIPFVRPIQSIVYQETGKNFFTCFVLGFLVCGFTLTAVYFRSCSGRKFVWNRMLWIFSVTAIYIYFTVRLRKHPEEAIHFLEYGFLSYLLFMALSHHIKDVTIYFSVSFITLFLGTLDEIIQWVIPGRYWDSRDVWMNFIAGVLLQIAIWKGISPAVINAKASGKSLLILSSIIAACLLLILLGSPGSPTRTPG